MKLHKALLFVLLLVPLLGNTHNKAATTILADLTYKLMESEICSSKSPMPERWQKRLQKELKYGYRRLGIPLAIACIGGGIFGYWQWQAHKRRVVRDQRIQPLKTELETLNTQIDNNFANKFDICLALNRVIQPIAKEVHGSEVSPKDIPMGEILESIGCSKTDLRKAGTVKNQALTKFEAEKAREYGAAQQDQQILSQQYTPLIRSTLKTSAIVGAYVLLLYTMYVGMAKLGSLGRLLL
jgi:hypothetical protein